MPRSSRSHTCSRCSSLSQSSFRGECSHRRRGLFFRPRTVVRTRSPAVNRAPFRVAPGRSRYKSATHFIVLLLSHHAVEAHAARGRLGRIGGHRREGPPVPDTPPDDPGAARPTSLARAEATIRITLSVLVWSLWFVSVMIVLFSALDKFLLVGTSTSAAWPYAAIQNFVSFPHPPA